MFFFIVNKIPSFLKSTWKRARGNASLSLQKQYCAKISNISFSSFFCQRYPDHLSYQIFARKKPLSIHVMSIKKEKKKENIIMMVTEIRLLLLVLYQNLYVYLFFCRIETLNYSKVVQIPGGLVWNKLINVPMHVFKSQTPCFLDFLGLKCGIQILLKVKIVCTSILQCLFLNPIIQLSW